MGSFSRTAQGFTLGNLGYNRPAEVIHELMYLVLRCALRSIMDSRSYGVATLAVINKNQLKLCYEVFCIKNSVEKFDSKDEKILQLALEISCGTRVLCETWTHYQE